MKYEINSTATYDKWFKNLKNRSTKIKILARLNRVENGNFGDHKPLKQGLLELRFVFAGGIRIYYILRQANRLILLNGGIKNTQADDIAKARQLITALE